MVVNNVPVARPGARSVWDIHARLEESFAQAEALLRQIESEDTRQRLAAVAELRRHIALAQKTLESAARDEAVQAFEETVMAALESADATVRQKVMDVLNARASNDREVPEKAA